jgi:hypothetical protein
VYYSCITPSLVVWGGGEALLGLFLPIKHERSLRLACFSFSHVGWNIMKNPQEEKQVLKKLLKRKIKQKIIFFVVRRQKVVV